MAAILMKYALVFLILLPSCGLYRTLNTAAEKIDVGLTTMTAIKEEADTNKDGRVDLQELLIWIGTILGTGGLGGAVWQVLRNTASGKMKAEMRTDIDVLKAANGNGA